MIRRIAVTLALSASVSLSSSPQAIPPLEPWEWPDEARVDALLDETAAAARVRSEQERQRGDRLVTTATSSPGHAAVDVIDGRKNPHLFFPFELFQHLVKHAYAPDANVRLAYRDSKKTMLRRHGLPADMWDRLEGITSAYRAARFQAADDARRVEKGDHISGATKPWTATRVCVERHAALIEAQTTFGPSFRKFLYTAVAPEIHRLLLRRADRAQLISAAKGECK